MDTVSDAPRFELTRLGEDGEADDGADVVAGLTATPKTLPCKYFYDAHGSELFERDLRDARVLPDAHRARDPGSARGRDRRDHRARGAGRARQRIGAQDPRAAGGLFGARRRSAFRAHRCLRLDAGGKLAPTDRPLRRPVHPRHRRHLREGAGGTPSRAPTPAHVPVPGLDHRQLHRPPAGTVPRAHPRCHGRGRLFPARLRPRQGQYRAECCL